MDILTILLVLAIFGAIAAELIILCRCGNTHT